MMQVAQTIGSKDSDNQWVDRLQLGMQEQVAIMEDFAKSASNASALLTTLGRKIEEFQAAERERRAMPVGSSYAWPTIDYFALTPEMGAENARRTIAAEIDSLNPGGRPTKWSEGDTTIKDALDFLFLEDAEKVADGFGKLQAGEDWDPVGTIWAATTFIPVGTVFKAGGKVAFKAGGRLIHVGGWADKGVHMTDTAKMFSKTKILDKVSYKQLSGSNPVWITKVLGTDGRGALAEIATFEHLAQSRPGLQKLYWNHKKVDLYNPTTKEITSIKSISPSAASYVDNPVAFKNQVKKYIEDVGNWDMPQITYDSGGRMVTRLVDNPDRELILAIPSTGLTQRHAAALDDLLTKEYPPTLNRVKITLIEMP
jgi:hypothetical protein